MIHKFPSSLSLEIRYHKTQLELISLLVSFIKCLLFLCVYSSRVHRKLKNQRGNMSLKWTYSKRSNTPSANVAYV